MSRRFADPIEVTRRDEDPAQFLWRGRLYLVREVLDRWSEAGVWWHCAAADVLVTAGAETVANPATDLVTAALPASPKWAQRAWGEPAPDVGAVAVLGAVDDREREYWRVEAGRGRAFGTGVFDLCQDTTSGAWWLTRALD